METVQRGDRVMVEGFRGERGVLRVWNIHDVGYGLTSERGFEALIRGEDAPIVGFPRSDVVEIVERIG
jgi:hypothetical protein